MSDSLSHLLRTVATECKELEVNFTLYSDWLFPVELFPLGYSLSFAFGWTIESGREGEIDSSPMYKTLEECLSGCLDHLKCVREER